MQRNTFPTLKNKFVPPDARARGCACAAQHVLVRGRGCARKRTCASMQSCRASSVPRTGYGDDEAAREAAGKAALLRAKESLSTGWRARLCYTQRVRLAAVSSRLRGVRQRVQAVGSARECAREKRTPRAGPRLSQSHVRRSLSIFFTLQKVSFSFASRLSPSHITSDFSTPCKVVGFMNGNSRSSHTYTI